MRSTLVTSLTGLILAVLTVCVVAGTADRIATEPATSRPEIVPLADVRPLQRATDLRFMPVRNLDSSLNGYVADIVLSLDCRRADYLAVTFYGAVGRLYKVTFEHLRATADGRTLVCDFTPERLQSLISFPADAWARDGQLRRVSRLLGLRARDAAGEPAGRIRDLLIESSYGMVTEATVGVGGFLGLGEDLASIEWSAVTLTQQYAQLDISAQALAERSYPKENYWQRLGFAGEKERPEPVGPPTYYPLAPIAPYF